MCPYCQGEPVRVVKIGFSKPRARDGGVKRVQRFRCRRCRRDFSEGHGGLFFRDKRSGLYRPLLIALCSGVSQRRLALAAPMNRKTVARKMMKLAAFADQLAEVQQRTRAGKVETIVFDEMETFEHTKCKPLSIVVAVEEKSRRILAVEVAQMPAKGRLARVARARYGRRTDHRCQALNKVFQRLRSMAAPDVVFKSDLCPRYPEIVRRYFPAAPHSRFKGRRGCVVGQGELKRGGFDPLFALNHTCAMIRDNLKRLTRRTWCTTKRPHCLQAQLNLYRIFHNCLLLPNPSPGDLAFCLPHATDHAPLPTPPSHLFLPTSHVRN